MKESNLATNISKISEAHSIALMYKGDTWREHSKHLKNQLKMWYENSLGLKAKRRLFIECKKKSIYKCTRTLVGFHE